MEISPSSLPFGTAERTPSAPAPDAQARAVQAALSLLAQNSTLVTKPSEFALTKTLIATLQTAAATQGGLAGLLTDLVQAQTVKDVPAQVRAAIAAALAVSAPIRHAVTDAEITALLIKLETPPPPAPPARPGLPAPQSTAAAPQAPIVPAIKIALHTLQHALQTWNPEPAAPQIATPASQTPAPATPPASALPQPATQEGTQRNAPQSLPPAFPPALQSAPPTPPILAQTQTATAPQTTTPPSAPAPSQPLATAPAPLTLATPPAALPSGVPIAGSGNDIAGAMVSLIIMQQPPKLPFATATPPRLTHKEAQVQAPAEIPAIAPAVPGSAYRNAQLNPRLPTLTKWPPGADAGFVARILAQRTATALAQLQLLEVSAGLQRPDERPAANTPEPRWAFELPFTTPQGNATARFEISRDTYKAKSGAQAVVWRAGFSTSVEPLGPVHAQIALLGRNAWVSLWAEREATMKTLQAQQQQLQQTFTAENVTAEVICCLGVPVPRHAASGSLVECAV